MKGACSGPPSVAGWFRWGRATGSLDKGISIRRRRRDVSLGPDHLPVSSVLGAAAVRERHSGPRSNIVTLSARPSAGASSKRSPTCTKPMPPCAARPVSGRWDQLASKSRQGSRFTHIRCCFQVENFSNHREPVAAYGDGRQLASPPRPVVIRPSPTSGHGRLSASRAGKQSLPAPLCASHFSDEGNWWS